MIPTYDQTECMNHIPHCDISNGLDSYYVKDNKYQCMRCLDDFVWNRDTLVCEPCDVHIAGCARCQKDVHGDPICVECKNQEENPMKFFKFPSKDGKRCVDTIQNCRIPIEIQPQGLGVHPNGKDWICKECALGYFIDEHVLSQID